MDVTLKRGLFVGVIGSLFFLALLEFGNFGEHKTKQKIKVNVVENTEIGDLKVIIDDIDFGSFEQLTDSHYFYSPKQQHKLTGDHFIAIGETLNKLNKA